MKRLKNLRKVSDTVWTDGVEYFYVSASGTSSPLTASRLLSTDASRNLSSVANLASWIAGTASEITVTDDGDGSVTLSLASGSLVTTTRIINTDSPYTALATDDHIFADTDAGAITINLPVGADGRKYRIINCGSSGNDLTVTPNGAETLLGSNSSITLIDSDVIILTFETTEGWW